MTVFYVFRFWPFSEVAPPLTSEMHRLPDSFCQVAAKQGETVLLVGSSEQLASETLKPLVLAAHDRFIRACRRDLHAPSVKRTRGNDPRMSHRDPEPTIGLCEPDL